MPFSRLVFAFTLFAAHDLSLAADDRAGIAFFEANIRPLLVDHCYDCHSSEKGQSKGGLTLDTRAGWMTGGDSGAAIVPGKPEESLLIKAVRYDDAACEHHRRTLQLSPQHLCLLKSNSACFKTQRTLTSWACSRTFRPRRPT